SSRHTRPTSFPYTTLFRSKSIRWRFRSYCCGNAPALPACCCCPSRRERGAAPRFRTAAARTRRRSADTTKREAKGNEEKCETERSEEHTSELQSPDHLVCR